MELLFEVKLVLVRKYKSYKFNSFSAILEHATQKKKFEKKHLVKLKYHIL